MSETKHTLVSYDCSGPTFAMAEPACDPETYLKEATRKLAEHPHLVAELDRDRSINADMLAALEAVVKELIYSRGEVFGPSDEEIVKLAKAAIAKAKGGAK